MLTLNNSLEENNYLDTLRKHQGPLHILADIFKEWLRDRVSHPNKTWTGRQAPNYSSTAHMALLCMYQEKRRQADCLKSILLTLTFRITGQFRLEGTSKEVTQSNFLLKEGPIEMSDLGGSRVYPAGFWKPPQTETAHLVTLFTNKPTINLITFFKI